MDGVANAARLYGRERELKLLLASFARISSGHGEILLVPGASGVGKTALVQELQKPIRDGNGFFVRGKFEQYQQNVPYFAFRQALAELCGDMQSEDAQQRARLKAEILEAVGGLGRVLIDLVPEFEAILGAQPPLEDISPQEARHRFAGVFRSFLQVVCLPEQPLVLFLDDWQWADAASCELLKHLEVGTTLRYLMVIVSYRDDEVDSGHPLMVAVDDLRSRAVPVNVLPVENITAHDVREIVTDTLQPTVADAEGMAAFIHGRTLGNPFFVRSFLDFLREIGIIRFDEERHSWLWEMDGIDQEDLPGDLVELFTMKLRRLEADTQYLLSLASFLGNRFDLDTLGIISGREPRQCAALLFSGQAAPLLLPLDGDEGRDHTADAGGPRFYSFAHDRVQQAAYSLIAPAERPQLQLKIGRLLLASLPPDQLSARLFDVVGDLNEARHLMRDATEQVNLLELNVAAARKAYAATAYGSALQFYRTAGGILEVPGLTEALWRDAHDLMMQLMREWAVCEFLEGSRTEGEECIQQAVARSASAIETAAALAVLIVQYTLLARYPEAIAAGRRALTALGISLPEGEYEAARNDEIAQVRAELGGRRISSLTELPIMTHPEMLMASQILIVMGPPCYRSDQRLWGVIVPKVVNLTLRHGNIPEVGYSHTAFGGLLGWVDGDYATAREFAKVATRLMKDTFQAASHQSVFYLMIGSSIRHWFKHLRHGTRDYADAYDVGLRSGNLQYAAYAFGHDMYCRFYQGVPLSGLIQETERSLAFSRTHVNQWAIDLMEGGLSVFASLSGGEPTVNGQRSAAEEEFLQRVEAHHNIQVTCIYQVLKTFSLLVSGDLEDALELSDRTEPLIYTVGTQGLLPWPEHVFARLLILTGLLPQGDERQQSRWRAELKNMMGRLRAWADNGPDNFQHKYLLAAAELARIDGRHVEAFRLYDRAIQAAQAGEFAQWEGLANERASAAWLECGNERLAHEYWLQAYVCYDRWGAGAKLRSMEAAYRRQLAEHLPGRDESPIATEEGPGSQGTEALLDRQVGQLRTYAVQMQQNTLRIEATTRAGDLAEAMQRVRVEIAERKRTEEALRESERLLRESQRIASLGSYVLDVRTGSWKSSDVLDTIFGIDQTYLHSVDGWQALIHPDDRAMVEDYLQNEVLGRGLPFDKTYRVIRHEGQSERWVHGLGKLEFNDEGRPVKLHGTIQDVTERKLAEVQREALLESLQEALDSVRTLSGLLPICSACKKIRDDEGGWSEVDVYVRQRTDTEFSHGMCPDCLQAYYPDFLTDE